MSRLLMLSDDYPSDPTSGQHIRVHALCREISRVHDCYFVAMSHSESNVERHADLRFREEVFLPARTKEVRSWTRHFRLSNSRIIEQNFPSFYRRTVTEVGKLAARWGASGLINFSPPFSEIGAAVNLPRMLDYSDSSALTLERVLANRGSEMTVKDRFLTNIQLRRQIMRDANTLKSYDLTTTIAEPDRKRLLEVSGIKQNRIVVVPNGVAPELMQHGTEAAKRTRSVVFWGNLDFPPNWTAVQYFYEQVYLPFLAGQGIEWYIVGKGSGNRLAKIAEHPLVHMQGFERDLASFVADKGVMINPMVEGSGLKNKVLEAFALGIPVVSTGLGVEAVNGNDGEHFLVADVPEVFARLVMQLLDDENMTGLVIEAASHLVSESYTWSAAGRQFEEVVQRMLQQPGNRNVNFGQ